MVAEPGIQRRTSRVIGYTDWASQPCVVTLRARDWAIVADPATGDVDWSDQVYQEARNTALPHELLHCLRGAWHPVWDDILARGVTIYDLAPPRSRSDGD